MSKTTNETIITTAGVSSNGTSASESVVYKIGYDGSGIEHRLYFKFEYPDLPDCIRIKNATLKLHQQWFNGSAKFNVYRTYGAWSIPLNWSNQPTVSSVPISSFDNTERYASDSIDLDITPVVASWYNQKRENHGIVISTDNTCECPDCDCYNDYVIVYGKDAMYSPTVVINYELVDEYADHQKYQTFDMGVAGSGAVNLFSGALTFTHSDVSATGGHLPLNISHVYRSDHADAEQTDYTFGAGWITSAQQSLSVYPDGEEHDVDAYYRDAMGRMHYFVKKTEDEGVVYYDTAGLGLSMTIDGNARTVVDEKGNIMTFNGTALSAIKDANGNTMSFDRDSNGYATKITDSIGRSAQLTYEGRLLTKITDHKGRVTSFTYTGNYLTKITYPDAKSVNFTYGENNRLISVRDHNSVTYDITYNDANRVVSASVSGKMSVSNSGYTTSSTAVNGGGFEIEYFDLSTRIKDKLTGVKTVHRFDSVGRVLMSYEDLSDNSSLPRGEMTPTEISEYSVLLNNKTLEETNGKYVSVKTGISGPAEMHENLLMNGNFKQNATGTVIPTAWEVFGSSNGGGYVASISDFSKNSITADSFRGYYFNSAVNNSFKGMSQTVDLTNVSLSGKVLIASAWVKAPTASSKYLDPLSLCRFDLKVKLTFTDGTESSKSADFDYSITDWQYVAVPIEIPSGKIAETATFYFYFSENYGGCYVTNACLCASAATITKIDHQNKGRTVSVLNESKTVNRVVTSTDGIFSTESVVDENYNTVMTTITDKNGKSFSTYTKYIGSMPKKVVDYRGAATVYTYDFEDEETPESAMFGNIVSTKKYPSEEATSCISNEAEYDGETGLIVKEINERGKETTYSYTNGEYLAEKVTFPNSLSYKYSYNSLNSNVEKITADNATSSVTSDDISHEFGYIGRLLTETSHNGFDFRYAYDELGRLKGVKINATSLLDISYANNSNGTTSSTTVYANNTSSEVISDSRGNPISKKVNGTQTSAAEYDECGNIKKLIDNIKGICYNYYYNSNGKIAKIEERNVSTNALVNTRTFTYDSCRRTLTASNTATGQQYCPVYEADSNSNKYPDNAVKGITLTGKYTDVVVKDRFNRPSVHELTLDSASSPLITDSYMYYGSGNSYTNYVHRIAHNAGNGNEYLFYTYDANGNINSVSDNTSVDHPWFTYDKFGRLSGEGLPKLNLERTYTYDDGGNMIGKVEKNTATGAVTTHSFLYSSLAWKDQLVCYDGNCITYDAIGNPTCYKGNALTWTNIRHLSSYGNNTFAYGADGIRYRKNNITYTLDGNKILKETDGTNTTVYYYGASGIIGFNYNGTDYYFRKNLQGDVITIYTANGTKAATYIYDAWGKVLDVTNYTSANIGDINPIRYRGYYYDTETELYYLESRYYDPETCRFINADTINYLDPQTIGGLNSYCYCANDPINKCDPTGHFPWLILAAVLLFTPVGGMALQGTTSVFSYAGIAVASIFDKNIRNDMNAIGWNPFNEDESATLNSSMVSFYKGVPVFRTVAGGRSGSFGAIFLTEGSDVDELRHERGHNCQLMTMGIANYGCMIGLPSWQEWSNRSYYERPWEITADVLGGVKGRNHLQEDITRGYWYLEVSSLFGPFGYLFLFGEY